MDEEQYLSFTCPHCGEGLEFLEERAGRAEACPHCGRSLVIPRASGGEAGRLPLPLAGTHGTLRLLAPTDEMNVLNVVKHGDWVAAADDEPRVLEWFNEELQNQLTDARGSLTLAVARPDSDELLRLARVRYIDAERCQAAITIDGDNGPHDVEVVLLLLWFCFHGLAVHRVTAECKDDEPAMATAFRRVGMRQEAEFVQDHRTVTGWGNTLCFAMLAKEFARLGNPAPRQPAAT